MRILLIFSNTHTCLLIAFHCPLLVHDLPPIYSHTHMHTHPLTQTHSYINVHIHTFTHTLLSHTFLSLPSPPLFLCVATSCLFYPVDKKMPAIRLSTRRKSELVGQVRKGQHVYIPSLLSSCFYTPILRSLSDTFSHSKMHYS